VAAGSGTASGSGSSGGSAVGTGSASGSGGSGANLQVDDPTKKAPDRNDGKSDKGDTRSDKNDGKPDKKATSDKKDAPDKTDKSDKKKDVEATPSAVPSNAQEAKALLADARSHYGANDWDGAFASYSHLADSAYLHREAYLGMAHASWQMSHVDATIKWAQAAVQAGAGDEAKKMLGHAYFKKGNYKQALIYYDDLLKKDAKDTEIRDAAAEAHKRMR
jgi:tetratricopeptide (TPR) repeat protein